MGAQFGVIAACGRSPPPPLDSARLEVHNPSFPSPLVDFWSPLTSKGISVILHSKGNFVIPNFVGILVIAIIEDKLVIYDPEVELVNYDFRDILIILNSRSF